MDESRVGQNHLSGSHIRHIVPEPSLLSHSKRPPIFSIRRRMLSNPSPVGADDSANPRPLSSILIRSAFSFHATRSQTSVACECLAMLFNASRTARYKLCRTSDVNET